jgi:ribosomal protein S16
MKKIIAVTLLLITGFYACKHEPLIAPITKDPTPPDTIPSGTTGVCFTKDVLPIFQSYCAKAGCHDAASTNDYKLDNYDNIMKRGITAYNASNSKIYRVIITTDPGDIMPQPGNLPLSQAQKDIIKKWIDEGAKNTACTSTCDPGLFTYSGFVQPILQRSCAGCHSGTAASGGINLTVFNTVKAVALNGRLYGAITHATGYKPMPNTSSKLSDCEITQIKKWIDAGAPQN